MSDFIYRPQIEGSSPADGVRRRHWSDEDKLRIVEESFVGHRQVAATARRHGMCRSLLTIWHRQYRRNGELGAPHPVSFTPVTVTKDIAVSKPGPVDLPELAGGDCSAQWPSVYRAHLGRPRKRLPGSCQWWTVNDRISGGRESLDRG